jgi:hypothetical protein
MFFARGFLHKVSSELKLVLAAVANAYHEHHWTLKDYPATLEFPFGLLA